MKFSDEFKRNWWYLSLILVGIGLLSRIESISSGNATDFDIGLLVVATALALIPLFSEFTFMGLTLKQQIEDTKQEVEATKLELKYEIKESQLSIQTELNNLISVSNNAQQVMYNNPPPDRLLETWTQNMVEIFQNFGVVPSSPEEIPDTFQEFPNPVEFAFKGRYLIEREIKRIWEDTNGTPPARVSMIMLLQELTNNQTIPIQLLKSIRQVNSVINPIIHGENYTNEQINFLKDTIPPLISALQKI